jgi:transcriptional regulator with XRE-family HTH domain
MLALMMMPWRCTARQTPLRLRNTNSHGVVFISSTRSRRSLSYRYSVAEIPIKGAVLRWARKLRGLSVDEAAARRLGIPRSDLEDYENERKRPTLGVIDKISMKYSINYGSLFRVEFRTIYAEPRSGTSFPAGVPERSRNATHRTQDAPCSNSIPRSEVRFLRLASVRSPSNSSCSRSCQRRRVGIVANHSRLEVAR